MVKTAAVIGNPISHSLSPTLHKFLLQCNKVDGDYKAILVEEDSFDQQIDQLLNDPNLAGFNVTIPYKEKIFNLFRARGYNISKKAQNIKAINTVYKKNGEIFADNSDIFGFEENLRQNSSNLQYNNALLLGAGGAASAALYSLVNLSFKNIYIYNRTQAKAEALATNQNSDNVKVISQVDDNILENLDLIVNSTSIGMKNDLKHNFSLQSVKNKNCHVYDLIYNPLHTDLLKEAQKLNLPIITGIGMLIYQGFLGFEHWFGTKPTPSKQQIEQISDILIKKSS